MPDRHSHTSSAHNGSLQSGRATSSIPSPRRCASRARSVPESPPSPALPSRHALRPPTMIRGDTALAYRCCRAGSRASATAPGETCANQGCRCASSPCRATGSSHASHRRQAGFRSPQSAVLSLFASSLAHRCCQSPQATHREGLPSSIAEEGSQCVSGRVTASVPLQVSAAPFRR